MSGAYVLLEDGTRFDGEALGAVGAATGEVVFNTAMTGYQEAVTDPSYHGQIITFTYPLVGNYGVSVDAVESGAIHARAVIMREGRNDPPDVPLPPGLADGTGGWLDWLEARGIPLVVRAGYGRFFIFNEIRTPQTDYNLPFFFEPSFQGDGLNPPLTPDSAWVGSRGGGLQRYGRATGR